jgi:hypothetical protein
MHVLLDGGGCLAGAVIGCGHVAAIVHVDNHETAADGSSVSFHGCDFPLPSETYVVGDARLCTSSLYSAQHQVYFNQEVGPFLCAALGLARRQRQLEVTVGEDGGGG